MEVLPEQGFPLSSFLPALPLTSPPALPPIQRYKPIQQPQTWPGTSSDLAWSSQAQAHPQLTSNLPAVVLGVAGYQQSSQTPTRYVSVPLPSSTLSGTTSISPILPSFLDEETHTDPAHQTPTILPSLTGTRQYESRHDPPPHQSPPDSLRQSSSVKEPQKPRIDSPSRGEGESQEGRLPMSRRSSTRTTKLTRTESPPITVTGDEWRSSGRELSEESMRQQEEQGETAWGRPHISPPAVPELRYSPMRSMSTASLTEGAPLPPPSPHLRSQTLPQLTTTITIARALYLLSTGKLVCVPCVLVDATLEELFEHFREELLADPDWARTPAGIDYAHYGYSSS